jgi:hypothetical protein
LIQGLEKLGFPWILSSEMSLFNGLRRILGGENFSAPLAHEAGRNRAGAGALERRANSGTSGGLGMQRIDHGTSLAQVLIFCKQLLALMEIPAVFWNFRPSGVMAGLVPAIHGLQPMTSWDVGEYCVQSVSYL